MMSIRAIALVSLGVLGFAALPVQAEQITKTVQQENVKAELSYEKLLTDGIPQTKNVRLRILRDSQSAFDQAPTINEYDRPLIEFDDNLGFVVRDLDGDKNPEVIADMYTGGAHCCRYSLIYEYDRDQKQYVESRAFWGNLGYQLRDLDRDGKSEFYSADDRFAYAFTSYAASAFPTQIWRLENGKLIDVTRQYSKEIYSNAYQLWQHYQKIRTEEDAEVKGVLAAYLADKYLLGQQEDGWNRLREAYQESDREEFFGSLRKFLKETGYAQ
ncbi:hypothetical protein [Leptolyngbya sp. NIES-2104]|uniref:hypothetical protein n=1 Tax=Leptolyngbya sp. NIES-2104 TaxID=1552121 RepID=UPI0006EC5D97|nr:hypothetical protein [Leptolyngbya sp. NIES-2104]GAP97092.1 hypothetical protein NIES2104_36390 [Leptolyngbya sp. NIES-2104]